MNGMPFGPGRSRAVTQTTPAGARLISLDLSPASLVVLGAAGAAAQETARGYDADDPGRWLRELYAEHGHPDFLPTEAP